MMNMTDLELKLKLAKELPELIEQVPQTDGETLAATILINLKNGALKDDANGTLKQLANNAIPESRSFRWLDTGKEITEREWDWVVRKIVNEIPLSKRQDYSSHLGMIVNRKHRMATTHWLQLTAIWQEQAAALEKIGAI